MKIEKKLIALSIFAITIGIATVIPMTFLMNVKAQTYAEPWFNIDIPYACFETGLSNNTDNRYILDQIRIQPSINYKALNQQPEARIEYFEITIYTNDVQLSKNTYYVSMTNTNNESPANLFDSFCRENWFNMSYFGIGSGGGIHIGDSTELPQNGETLPNGGTFSGMIIGSFDEFSDIAKAIENTQTIYLDVRRTYYVTFDGYNTIVTLANNQVIHHIELTKNGNAFTFGELLEPTELIYATPGDNNNTTTAEKKINSWLAQTFGNR
ncbi:MAG: hypothetical protein FWE56_02275 [Candidatus Bathyarchaeota archaeon]|nr:hypothetical protein [Candidatus Termiticorpusculum sp.]MCL2868322.1 hypothetical protein [Candidatus Termiticorpusculum sp.]